MVGTTSPSQYPSLPAARYPGRQHTGLFPVPMLSDALLYAALLTRPEAGGFLSDRRAFNWPEAETRNAVDTPFGVSTRVELGVSSTLGSIYYCLG